MKRSLLLLTLGAFLTCPAWAQTDSTNAPPANPPPPGDHPHRPHMDFLTPEEKQELKAAHDAAVQANPDLVTEEKDLRQKMKDARDSGEMPDPDLFAQMQALRKKLHDAMIKADPKVEPILAKVDAHMMQMHHEGGWGGPGGSPPPAPTTNSAPSGT